MPARRVCPECKEHLTAPYLSCRFCDWVEGKTPVRQTSQIHRMTPEAKTAYEAGGPTSHDLTPQQWYNVCRFWPSVARRCSRPLAKVGPDNPLHATSRMGPLLKHRLDPEAEAERLAIQSEK